MKGFNANRPSALASGRRLFRIAPATRAIRAALSVSAAVLALSGSGVVAAGTCAATGPLTFACNGIFTETVPGTIFAPVVDMTLILGDAAPTSVVPAAGEIGVLANWGGSSTIISQATIATDGADGIQQFADTDASLTNHGNITTYASDATVNAVDISAYGDVTFVNDGEVLAYSDFAGDVTAVTAQSHDGSVSVENLTGGSIAAFAYDGTATGIAAIGRFYATVDNSGFVEASVSGDIFSYGPSLNATGIDAFAASLGGATVVNSGDIGVRAAGYSYNDSTAIGIRATANSRDASVTNSGTIEVDSSAYAYYGSSATGIAAYSGTRDALVGNSGSLSVSAAYGTATGIIAVAGIAAGSVASNAVVSNSGSIEVYGAAGAIGIYASTGDARSNYPGTASIANSGDISVTSYDTATGVYAYSRYGDSADVSNLGSIDVGGYFANGAVATAMYGDVSLVNAGDIAVEGGYATGMAASAWYDGSVGVDNSGSLAVSGQYQAIGITADTKYGNTGTIEVLNSGSVDVDSFYGAAAGIVSGGYDGTSIGNTGEISVTGFYYAAGVIASEFYGDLGIANSGTISVTGGPGYYYGADAVGLSLYNYAGAISVDNSGSIDVLVSSFSILGSSAAGITAYNVYGDVDVVNSGSIAAAAESLYYGYFYGTAAAAVDVINLFGDVSIVNAAGGEISALATAAHHSADATAISVLTVYGDTSIANAGDILASARSGEYAAFTSAVASGIRTSNYAGGATEVGNTGSILAAATLSDYSYYSSATAYGIVASGGYGGVSITNAGDIVAEAGTGGGYGYDNSAYAYGIVAYGYDGDVTITNSGLVQALASTDGSYASIASATGISALVGAGGYAGLAIMNSGTVSAQANDFATGIQAVSAGYGDYGHVGIVNSGQIEALAEGGLDVLALGIYAAGFTVGISNTGNVDAFASGEAGHAIGIYASSVLDVFAANSGDVSAEFDAGLAAGAGDAVGVELVSQSGEASLLNNGDILATSAGTAVGVSLLSDIAAFLVNNGSISGNGSATASIAVLTGAGADTIENFGMLNGSVLTGAGSDSLLNDGVWNPVGASDFGTGADLVYNAGTINLMGDSSIAVDVFFNARTLDFQDGAPDDTLTITGDFAGDGDILVDVSSLLDGSDLLYIDGNVLASSNSVIDVDFVGLPTTQTTEIPIVYVSGTSIGANFALGDVDYSRDNFLSLDFSLVADIDASNATDDVFSLAVDVSGLSDSGTLASAVAPGVLSLMNAQVGTWRQRMGVVDGFREGAISPWLRAFHDKGNIDPGHVASNFGQGGNFGFEQTNSGIEAGIDFAVSEQFSMGLLVAKADAEQRLERPGVGNSEIDGDSYGIYGTWLSPEGFYVDASYRFMDFEARLQTATGAMHAGGDANTLNLEAGYAWTLFGGLKIEPQFQYTRTRVDNLEPLAGTPSVFRAEGADSSRGRVGVMVRKSFGSPGGTLWTPYASLNAIREFEGSSAFSVNEDFFGETSIKGTSALAEVGFTARIGNLAVFGGVNWQDGGAYRSFVGGQLGVRYSFGGAAPANGARN